MHTSQPPSPNVDVSDRAARLLGVVSYLLTAAGAPQGFDLESANGKAYAWVDFIAAKGVGNLGMMELFNPGGSGKRIYVDRVSAYINGATSIFVCVHNASVAGAPAFGEQPKLAGGAASGMTLTEFGNAAILGTRIAELSESGVPNPVWVPRNPVVLDPGFGIIIANITANQAYDGAFEYRVY